jgi:membrane protein required for beta-lactamase induction
LQASKEGELLNQMNLKCKHRLEEESWLRGKAMIMSWMQTLLLLQKFLLDIIFIIPLLVVNTHQRYV